MGSRRCGACRDMKRKCTPGCVFSPYFPHDDPTRFKCVRLVYGRGNFATKIEEIPVEVRREAIEAMCVEARYRVDDPVYGCVKTISQLQHEISVTKNELARIRGEIAILASRLGLENETGGSTKKD